MDGNLIYSKKLYMCTLVSGTVASFRDIRHFNVRGSWLLLYLYGDITLVEPLTPNPLNVSSLKTFLDIDILGQTSVGLFQSHQIMLTPSLMIIYTSV